MPRATAVLREKVIDEEANILELVIWQVPRTPPTPAAVRYRLAFVRRGETAPVVLYDNHPPKGPHRHVEGVQGEYAFDGVDRLLTDFMTDVRRVKGARR